MQITLPEVFEHETLERVAINLAVGFYTDGADLGEAAEIAGLSIPDFMQELCRREIPLNYTLQDLEDDIATVRSLPPP